MILADTSVVIAYYRTPTVRLHGIIQANAAVCRVKPLVASISYPEGVIFHSPGSRSAPRITDGPDDLP
jgi:hypothetical protein